MPVDFTGVLVLGISSRALFDAEEEHDVFIKFGKKAYVEYQIEHEDYPMKKGTAFPLADNLLNLNLEYEKTIVEVVVISQNEPEAGLRVMNSIDNYKLNITRAAFTGGESVSKYLKAFNVVLFLSRDENDVREAINSGIPSAQLYGPPEIMQTHTEQLRIAFDGDAVIFSDESERIFQEEGIERFFEHERENAIKALPEGPFAPFLKAIANIQSLDYPEGKLPPINIALVTARNSPAHKRVILTLRAWNIKINEMFFMGGVSKDKILKEYKPHIFFDDQETHTGPASEQVPTGKVLSGVKNEASIIDTKVTSPQESLEI
jgi:5'-nucleotidase